MVNVCELIQRWQQSDSTKTDSTKTLKILRQYIFFEETSTVLDNATVVVKSKKYRFQFQNAVSGKILGEEVLSKAPSWEDLRQYVIHFISPLCKHSSSKFYYKDIQFDVCFRPQRWVKFSIFDINIIHIMPGLTFNDDEATDYLQTLIEENNFKLVKRMLLDAPSLIPKNPNLLHMICCDRFSFNEEMNETLECVRLLIKMKCDVNKKQPPAKNTFAMTPMQICAERHNYKTIKVLIEAKAKVNIESNNVWCPLRLAIRNSGEFYGYKKFRTVKALINAKSCLNDFSLQKPHILQFALQNYTCYTGDHKVIGLLIKAKARVNHSNITGNTPLHYAVMINEIEKTLTGKDKKRNSIKTKPTRYGRK